MATIVDLDGRPYSTVAIETLLKKDPSGNLLKAAAQFTILVASSKGGRRLSDREVATCFIDTKDRYWAEHTLEKVLTPEEMQLFPAVSEGMLYLREAAIASMEAEA